MRLCRGGVPGALSVKHLVEGFEDQPLSVILEFRGDLLPEGLVALLDLVIYGLVGPEPGGSVRARVVVHVEDAVHPFVEDVAHDFLHPGHPHGIHRVARPGGHIPVALFARHRDGDRPHVGIPGHGHADGAEALFPKHMDEFAGGDGLSPGGLVVFRGPPGEGFNPHIVQVAAVGFQRVAQVPAQAHIHDGLCGALPVLRLGIGPRGRRQGFGREVEADGGGRLLVGPVALDRSFRQGERVALAAGEAPDVDRQLGGVGGDAVEVGAPVHGNPLLGLCRALDILVEVEDDGQGLVGKIADAVFRGRGEQRRRFGLFRLRLYRAAAGRGQQQEWKVSEQFHFRFLNGSRREGQLPPE